MSMGQSEHLGDLDSCVKDVEAVASDATLAYTDFKKGGVQETIAGIKAVS